MQVSVLAVTGGLRAALRHELRCLLYAPLTPVFLAGFSLALSILIFLVADFYATDEASIRLLLVFLPWVALILAPALAMRAWLDVQGERSAELAMTLPLGPAALTLGKYLAGVAVLMLALLLSVPFALTVAYLGAPDLGALLAGYLGCALALAAFYAIAFYAASFVREQVSAFVLGLGALLLIVVLGWDALGRFLGAYLPAHVLAGLAAYSPTTWLAAMGAGLIEYAGVLYLLALVAIALAGAAINTALCHRRARAGRVLIAKALLAVAALCAVALARPVTGLVPGFVDLTEHREFTLSGATQALLAALPVATNFALYWSESEATVPARIKTHARRIERTLEQMQRAARGRLAVRHIDPRPDTDQELFARSAGVRQVPMSSGDTFYLGGVAAQGDRQSVIPYFDAARASMLEYDLAVAVSALARARVSNVGILSPLLAPSAALGEREGLSFMAELRRSYDVAVIPFFANALPADLDVLVVLHAPVLKRELLYDIDQFLMSGGRVVMMLDPYLRFDRKSNELELDPSVHVDDISDLLLAYGVRFRPEQVVGDLTLAAPVADAEQQRSSFPFWLRVPAASLSAEHPVTAGLSELFLAEPGAFQIAPEARATPLIMTTNQSGGRARADFSALTPQQLSAGFEADGEPRALALALRGPLQSAYRTPPDSERSAEHRLVSGDDALLFAVADVDWLFDAFSLQVLEGGGSSVRRPLNDNLSFLLNMIEFASGSRSLISIRTRGELQRPFTRVERLFRAAQQRYRKEEARLASTVAEVESRIAQALDAAGVSASDELPVELRDQVRAINEELLPVRKALRGIRRRIREDVEALGTRLTVINALAGPVLTVLLAVVFHRLRKRTHRRLGLAPK